MGYEARTLQSIGVIKPPEIRQAAGDWVEGLPGQQGLNPCWSWPVAVPGCSRAWMPPVKCCSKLG